MVWSLRKNNNELVSVTFGGTLSWIYQFPKPTVFLEIWEKVPPSFPVH